MSRHNKKAMATATPSTRKALSPENLFKLKEQEKESTHLENYFNQKFGSRGS